MQASNVMGCDIFFSSWAFTDNETNKNKKKIIFNFCVFIDANVAIELDVCLLIKWEKSHKLKIQKSKVKKKIKF